MKYALIGIGAVVIIGGGAYALVPRSVLKDFFQTGDKPTQEQFSTTIDSTVNLPDDKAAGTNVTGQKEYNPSKNYGAGDTVVKSQAVYQAKVVTQDQPEFKLDAVQSVTFRWTPVVPKPQGSVTYRLKVWQLMQGQSGSQAMKSNQPIVTKDVSNASEATVSGIYTGPCKPPYLCDFVWSVEAVSVAQSNTGTGTGAAATPAAADMSVPEQSTGSSDGTSGAVTR